MTFTAKRDTTVNVYFTKESYDNKQPDDTISLTANQEKTTTYDRENIYIFEFAKPIFITSAKIVGTLLNCNGLFAGSMSLDTLDLSNFDTSKVTDMSSMFYHCLNLTTIGPVDTAIGWQHKLDDYRQMFDGCPATPKPSWYDK